MTWHGERRRHAEVARGRRRHNSIYSQKGASKARREFREKFGFKSMASAEKARTKLIQEFRKKPLWQQNLHRGDFEAELRKLDIMTNRRYAYEIRPWEK